MEISPDIFIQITEMGQTNYGTIYHASTQYETFTSDQFAATTDSLENCTLQKATCDFLLPVYKNYKSVWQSGTNSGTKA